MAKDKTSSKDYEGRKEYPKYVGSGESRRLVNNEVEEDAHAKEFGEAPKPDDKSKAAGWDTKK